MHQQHIYTSLLAKAESGKKQLAVLLDPDKLNESALSKTIEICNKAAVDFIFFGGSLLNSPSEFELFLKKVKELTNIPVILFPGSSMQVSATADGILLLSLISGRNPEFLIGQHVLAAPYIKSSGIEVLPTGYMLVESGRPTTVSYISNTTPIPSDKADVAVCTAVAGEMLGLKLIYMDGGSGALHPINEEMINKVKQNIQVPLIIGGGINSVDKALAACNAGADIIVIGNAFEKSPELITQIKDAISAL
jgi:phosphoglycerol geranylgeranyltransferase